MHESAHWGYQDGEQPSYDPCEECGMMLRVDRLDLLFEHEACCAGETSEERRAAIAAAVEWLRGAA